MDSEKGNRVFARGAQCAPPWFLEPKKSLVWIGLKALEFGVFFAYFQLFQNCAKIFCFQQAFKQNKKV